MDKKREESFSPQIVSDNPGEKLITSTFNQELWQAAFDAKREVLHTAVSNRVKEIVDLYIAMSRVGLSSSAELIKLIDKAHYKGALPTTDFDHHGTFCVAAPQRWTSYYEVNQWAAPILSSAHLYAIVSSHQQIETKRFVPLGLMKFANVVYRGDRLTINEVEAEIVTLDESIIRDMPINDPLAPHFHLRQFELVMARLVKYIQSLSHTDIANAKPICLFEFPSFNHFSEDDQRTIAHAIQTVFDASNEHGVPVVGCQASPTHDDLVQLIVHAADLKGVYPIYDVLLLETDNMQWGERTPIFVKTWHSLTTGFIYLKTDMNMYPVRLNFPLWMFEQNLVEQVADVVLADCMMGNGRFRLLNAAKLASQLNKGSLQQVQKMLNAFINHEVDVHE